MANKVGSIPEFTGDVSLDETQGEVKPQEETTPSEASTEEPSGETQPKVEEIQPEEMSTEDTGELAKQTQGLQEEKNKLLEEIMTLRGERRNLRETAVQQITQKSEDLLKDLNPQDVEIFEKLAKATGYVSQQELNQKFYNEIKQEELGKFLEKYPEYKPANDPGDRKWNQFKQEFELYRTPGNPREIGTLLDKVHKSLTIPSGDRGADIAKQKSMETASIGSKGKGGAQRSNSLESFSSNKVYSLRSGGYTDEEILKILNKTEI